ncbi:MAG: SDR family oxidoreductase [Oscillospiraceae bacterium]|nr:SDR family oxidoreductase [Oscillospiraceae bacterium]
MAKVAIVTGGSSGIGLETVRALREAGCVVYAVSRRPFEEAGTFHIQADVTEDEAVQAAVERVYREQGRIDILVNDAGMGISGAAEFNGGPAGRHLFDVNFFGMTRFCDAVMPYMRRQGGGRIVNIGSIAGIVPIPFQAYYSASKAAVHSYTMALANEIRPFGITVCALMPGDIATGFTAARDKIHQGDDIYAGRIGRSVAKMEHDEETGMAPAKVGAFVAKLCLKKWVRPLYSLGFFYGLVKVLSKLLPAGLFNRLVGLLYAA